MQARSLYSQDGRVPPPPLQLPHQVQLPENEQLRCPRCDSTDTKFCYYNNYNLSQPRHFCRSCKRYWTRGGTLRNIPVGGSTRKNTKRGPSDDDSCSSASATAGKRPASAAPGDHFVGGEGGVGGDVLAIGRVFPPAGAVGFEGPFGNLADAGGSFTSLLGGAGGQFAGFGEGQPPGLQMVGDLYGEAGQNMDPLVVADGFSGPDEEFLNMAGEEGEWSGGDGEWPHLSMYPPGSSYM